MNNLARLIIKGGVLSPGELKVICHTVEELDMDAISFGSRQDILLPDQVDNLNLKKIGNFDLVTSQTDRVENIMSSYVCSDIFPSTLWLTGDKYLYLLEQFRKPTALKVNITDPKQRLVPLFTGHLNFIASDHEDYWFLYVRLPDWSKTVAYPALVFSWDMAKITSTIESILKEEPDSVDMIFELVNDAIDTNNITIDKPLFLPFHPFPYYEGMNRIGNDRYWLGLYWRNNRYDLNFLKAMCALCVECKIGKIQITPWKSFIVKGIPANAKVQWEKFLGKFGINVRHSMLELNWHIPVGNDAAYQLKKYLVKNFDENDISTYGLTFGITDYVKKAYYFTSIVIEKNNPPDDYAGFKTRDTYNILHAKNFDPNTREYIIYVQDIDKNELSDLLIELSKLYFEQLGAENEETTVKKTIEETTEVEVYQCKNCLTVYNEVYGDLTQNIAENTPFEELNDNYRCSICDAPKSDFEKKIFIQKVSATINHQ